MDCMWVAIREESWTHPPSFSDIEIQWMSCPVISAQPVPWLIDKHAGNYQHVKGPEGSKYDETVKNRGKNCSHCVQFWHVICAAAMIFAMAVWYHHELCSLGNNVVFRFCVAVMKALTFFFLSYIILHFLCTKSAVHLCTCIASCPVYI